MISVVSNISTLDLDDRSTSLDPATSGDRDSEALRSFGSSSAGSREQAVVLDCSNIWLLQRIYGAAEAREGVEQVLLSNCGTQILFKPAA